MSHRACRPHATRAAFALIEALAVILVLAALVCVVLPGVRYARSDAKLVKCIQNLYTFAGATSAYAGDYEGHIWNFSWQKHNWQSQLPPGQTVPGAAVFSDSGAASAQAIYLIRTRAGRTDMDYVSGWFPHPRYSHLVALDYMKRSFSDPLGVCPEDKHRLNWQRSPTTKFDTGFWLPFQPSPGSSNKRWAYSGTYQVVPASFDHSDTLSRINQQFTSTISYSISSSAVLHPASLSDVSYPWLKVQLLDDFNRHNTTKPAFFSIPGNSQPFLMFDGSVPIVRAASLDPGWIPHNPTSPSPTQMTNSTYAWDPTYPGAPGFLIVKGAARWTRDDLQGRDWTGEN